MISKSRKLPKTNIDVADTKYEINDNNSMEVLEPICEKILLRKELLIPIEKAQIGYNLQACILCDIIETQLFFNYLQCIIMEETLHYAIIVERNQCNDRSQ